METLMRSFTYMYSFVYFLVLGHGQRLLDSSNCDAFQCSHFSDAAIGPCREYDCQVYRVLGSIWTFRHFDWTLPMDRSWFAYLPFAAPLVKLDYRQTQPDSWMILRWKSLRISSAHKPTNNIKILQRNHNKKYDVTYCKEKWSQKNKWTKKYMYFVTESSCTYKT